MDNVLPAQEMIHTLQSQKKAGMMMKIYLSKEYDKVNSHHLEEFLKVFSFAEQWIVWILALVKSTKFSLLVNGAPSAQFSFARSRAG